jgi:diguanylate cyclase (GGDEF)-like protein/PAS domain S-box-containing protein
MPAVIEHGHEIAELYVESATATTVDEELIRGWKGDDLVIEVDVRPTPRGRDYRYRSVCASFADLLGRSAADLPGRRLDDVLPADVAARTARWLDRAVDGGGTVRLLRDVGLDDRRATVETTTTPVRHADGSLTVLTVVRDVTTSVNAARSADRGRAMLQRVFAISPDMIALVGQDGRIEYANAAFARVLGYDPVSLIGTVLTSLFDAPSGVMLDDLGAMDPGELVPARMRSAAGSWRDVDVTVSGAAEEAPPSEPLSVVVVARDMTAARRNSQALARRRRQMGLLAELGQQALRELDPDAVLASAVSALTDGLEVPFGLAARLIGDGSAQLVATQGMEAIGRVGDPLALDDEGSARWVVDHDEPLVVHDWRREDRCEQSLTTRALGVRSGISVAVRTGGGAWGLLSGSARESRDFNVHDADFVRGVSHLVAAAVERQEFEARLRRQALHDVVTGLPNRSLLFDRLTHALDRRDAGRLVLCFIDLDDFARINNHHGHAVGDQVLAEVSRRLDAQVRHGDTVARYGGDEFVVVCEDLDDENEAIPVAQRIRHAVRESIVVGDRTIEITASVGLAGLSSLVGPDGSIASGVSSVRALSERLIDAADEAMYAAKVCGGDAVVGLGLTAAPRVAGVVGDHAGS